jgi:hypothetical protein
MAHLSGRSVAIAPWNCIFAAALIKATIREVDRMVDKDQWRRRDHKFAVGTIALMVFLILAGFTSWLLSDDTSTAAPSSLHGSAR